MLEKNIVLQTHGSAVNLMEGVQSRSVFGTTSTAPPLDSNYPKDLSYRIKIEEKSPFYDLPLVDFLHSILAHGRQSVKGSTREQRHVRRPITDNFGVDCIGWRMTCIARGHSTVSIPCFTCRICLRVEPVP